MTFLRRILRPPGGTSTFLALLVLCMPVIATIWRPEHWLRPVTALTSLCALAGGIAMWFRQRWGHWLATAFFLAIAGRLAVTQFAKSPWPTGLIIAGCVYCAWNTFRARPGEEESDDNDGGPVSLVGLFRELPYLDEDVLARAATRAWGTPIAGSEAPGDATGDFVAGESPAFLIVTGGRTFLINHFDRPYFDDPEEAAKSTWEMRHQAVVREHQAWLSVDLLAGADDAERTRPTPEVYSRLGRLLAELVDESCLAILCPAEGKMFVCDAETEEHLRSDDPLAALSGATQAPMIVIGDDDPRMQAAVHEARSRWGEFVEAFASRAGDAPFYVKFPLREGDEVEFIWAEVSAIENDVIYAALANDPLHSRKKLGDRIQTRPDELNDWNYLTPGGEMIGGFTIRVLADAAREREKGDDRE